MNLINQRNYKKFLKALRTESLDKVLINVLRKVYRTVFKTYKKNKIEFQGTKPSILWVLPNFPEKDKSSGERRLHHLFDLLSPYFEIYIFTEGVRSNEIPKGITLIPEMVPQKLKREIPFFHYIIFSWFTTFEENSIFKSLYPTSKLIIDSVDIHWIREERAIGTLKGLSIHDVAETQKRELAAYSQVDYVWTVTTEDKTILLKHIPDFNVQVISNVHDIIVTERKIPQSNKILFLGSYNHYPNLKAAQYLSQNIFPKIKLVHPDAELILAGSNPPDSITCLANGRDIFVTGFISDDELSKLYNEVLVSIIPLFSGSGIKGKICESISFGVPVIINDIGNEGIDLIHEKEALVVPNEKMADAAIALLNGQYNLPEMIKLSQHKISLITSPNVVQKALLDVFFPIVSICIVTHNRLELLKNCIDSILENTLYPKYQIIVYSNACKDRTVEYFKNLAKTEPRIQHIFSETNEVFVKPNNTMMRESSPHDVVLLNNDTIVTKGWLLGLFTAVYSSPEYGIAGSKLLNPDGTLQEFGAELNIKTGIGFNRGKGDDPKNQEYQGIRETGYVSGCAMYIKRSTINKIGVFDEKFHPCYYEDSDYCYTAKASGLKTIVTAASIVYHHEGATSGGDSQKYQSINKEKFVAKHFLKF